MYKFIYLLFLFFNFFNWENGMTLFGIQIASLDGIEDEQAWESVAETKSGLKNPSPISPWAYS